MKITNSTEWDTGFLRRMTSWCCKQLHESSSIVWRAQFTNTARAFKGRAMGYSGASRGRILIRVGPAQKFPHESKYPSLINVPIRRFEDRLECLVAVTAHEIHHLAQMAVKGRCVERSCEHQMLAVLNTFRANRESLIGEWMNFKESEPKLKASVVELRALKAEKMLAAWRRKLKLAQTKTKQYIRRVKYYERVAAQRDK